VRQPDAVRGARDAAPRPGRAFEYRVDDAPTFTARQIRDAVPSHDGRRLAFIALSRLYVMDFPDGMPQRVTSDNVVEYGPVWSPDGQWLTYATWSDRHGQGHIHRARAVPGARSQRLTTTPGFYTNLAITPNGARIAAVRASAGQYLDDTSRRDAELVWIPATGGAPTVIHNGDERLRHSALPRGYTDRIYVFGVAGLRRCAGTAPISVTCCASAAALHRWTAAARHRRRRLSF
jgi:hypothetical protein